MSSDFLAQIGVMALTFGVAILVGLTSRRMERSDQLTLIAIPIAAFPLAILPGIIAFGFEKNAATYVLGALTVVTVATLNYRFQPRTREATEKAEAESPLGVRIVKEA
jgi:prepilin signal peptidase PulO-like enzyme (type II secretory pathway)